MNFFVDKIISDKKDKLFDDLSVKFSDQNKCLNVGKFLSALEEKGIQKTDRRLEKTIDKIREIHQQRNEKGTIESLSIEMDVCRTILDDNLILFGRAFRDDFIIPDFPEFCKHIEDIYWNCKNNTEGKVADYIPQLAKFNPEYWGVSICTVDGQRFSIGNTNIPFTIQSTGKPINYAIALNELGTQEVHKYVGKEPSGRMFNELVLDYNGKPHNPMVNAGAIVVCSLLQDLIKPEMNNSEKFEFITDYYKSMNGNEFLGFNNATFMSEKSEANRNFAIAYFMKEKKCFPENTVLKEALDFYFQLCSLEVNCESLSVMAGTLANGGICPVTDESVMSNESVRNCLSLMLSCGMYDYSGQFAFNVGIPAKSGIYLKQELPKTYLNYENKIRNQGVSGSMMVVVPNVMGICLWSPPLDSYGNSVRGVEFCKQLVSMFNFHHFDDSTHCFNKKDPRKKTIFNNSIN